MDTACDCSEHCLGNVGCRKDSVARLLAPLAHNKAHDIESAHFIERLARGALRAGVNELYRECVGGIAALRDTDAQKMAHVHACLSCQIALKRCTELIMLLSDVPGEHQR